MRVSVYTRRDGGEAGAGQAVAQPVAYSKSSSRQTPAAGTSLDGDSGFKSEGDWYFDEEKTKRHVGSPEAGLLEEIVSGLKEDF